MKERLLQGESSRSRAGFFLVEEVFKIGEDGEEELRSTALCSLYDNGGDNRMIQYFARQPFADKGLGEKNYGNPDFALLTPNIEGDLEVKYRPADENDLKFFLRLIFDFYGGNSEEARKKVVEKWFGLVKSCGVLADSEIKRLEELLNGDDF
jgi:hypothetical protein